MDILVNRKAYHDYEIIEEFTAGIVLLGPEVKALHLKQVSLKDSFVTIIDNEVFWKNGHMAIPSYVTLDRPDEKRDRKLLLNKKEIRKINEMIKEKGYTVIPLKLIKVRGMYKLVIAVAQGLKKYDKRQKLKEKDQKRDIQRALKDY